MILSGLWTLDTLEGPDYLHGRLSIRRGLVPQPHSALDLRLITKKNGSRLPVCLPIQSIGQRGAFRLNPRSSVSQVGEYILILSQWHQVTTQTEEDGMNLVYGLYRVEAVSPPNGSRISRLAELASLARVWCSQSLQVSPLVAEGTNVRGVM